MCQSNHEGLNGSSGIFKPSSQVLAQYLADFVTSSKHHKSLL